MHSSRGCKADLQSCVRSVSLVFLLAGVALIVLVVRVGRFSEALPPNVEQLQTRLIQPNIQLPLQTDAGYFAAPVASTPIASQADFYQVLAVGGEIVANCSSASRAER